MKISSIVNTAKSLFIKNKDRAIKCASAVALVGTLVLADSAMAVYTPPVVTLEGMLDQSTIAATLLTMVGAAFAIVVGISLSFTVGRKFVSWIKRAF